LTVFVPSIALGWTYQKTQSLACTIGLHILFNGLFLLLVC
jgi:membrane protease YdiL (CAAX protease family)